MESESKSEPQLEPEPEPEPEPKLNLEIEPPECPVCLQYYNNTTTIPRVLQCGHTTCETCISNLHKLHFSTLPSNTIRCPCCTQLLPFNSLVGPSSLPKNIDLLRYSPSDTPTQPPRQPPGPPPLRAEGSSLYSHWKNWVVPYVSVSGGFMVEDQKREVGFVQLGRIESGGSDFVYGYLGKVMRGLGRMSGSLRDEIKLILGASVKNSRVCDFVGLWLDDGGDGNDGVLYLVYVKLRNGGLLNFGDFEWLYLGLIGVELSESLMSLNLEGVVCGCLGLPCVCFDDFGHVCIDLGEVLCVGGKFRECVVEGVLGGRTNGESEVETVDEGVVGGRRNDECEVGAVIEGVEQRNDESEVEAVIVKMSNIGAFVAPEMVLELIHRERSEVEKNDASFAGCESDVWLLACVLIRLLVGDQFAVEMYSYLRPVFRGDDEGVHECKDIYLQWVETIKALFQPFVVNDCGASIYEILIKCLDFDPKSRPLITDVWKCLKELNRNHFTKYVPSLNSEYYKDKGYQCLLLGELCNMSNDRRNESRMSRLPKAQDDCKADLGLARKAGVDNVVKGLSASKVQCKNLQGHLDCITGFCIGGGYLFSSSFDKTVNVWSLQDFIHVHTFKGHENRVMDLVFVNGEKPVCISADIGGGIFAWEINEPLPQEPLKKWFEEKDWRYSGIHALAVSESGCLYTGSGDRLIKVWLLRDCTLVCSMEGHKSVVSTLALSNGVLYSGSWDGTVRLWCLHDHSPLAVFGEDIHGPVSSVLSLVADQNMTIAAFENGCMKIWVTDVLKTSIKIHDKAIFALAMEGKRLFSGGWDQAVKFQEITGDGSDLDITEVGSFTCDSVVTALLCQQGLLFVGYANKLIKVYCCDMIET